MAKKTFIKTFKEYTNEIRIDAALIAGNLKQNEQFQI